MNVMVDLTDELADWVTQFAEMTGNDLSTVVRLALYCLLEQMAKEGGINPGYRPS